MSFRTAYGYARSENGWRMCNRDECVLVPGPYMSSAPLRRGPAEIVLGDLVRRHHVEVEPIRSSVWGWSQNNDVGNSNHLAGTAVDVLAPWRPWGARVLSQNIIDKTNRLLASYDGGVFWGRNWNRADEMHFQLNWPEGDKRWDALIAKIQGRPAPAPPVVVPGSPSGSWAPTLQYGSSGAAVSLLQANLNRVFSGYAAMPLVVDGDFGPATKAAIAEFQSRVGIERDGIVGPATWAQLNKYGVHA